MMTVLHGDAVFDSTGVPCMAELDHLPGDYIAPGLLPGSVQISTSGKGARRPRLLLVRAGWCSENASRAVHNVLLPLLFRQQLGESAAAQTGFRASLQRTIIIHISAWSAFLLNPTAV